MVDSFLKYLRYEKRYSEHTLTAYEKDLEQFTNFLQETFEIDDLCFLPYEKTINAGETVLFVNEDEFEHNVRLRGDPNYLHFPTDVIRQNEYFVYKFEYSGKFQYHCTLHPWMEGVIDIR